MYTKNVSQLLLVYSGYHTHLFQHTDDSRVNVSVMHLFLERDIQSGSLSKSANKANAYLSM